MCSVWLLLFGSDCACKFYVCNVLPSVCWDLCFVDEPSSLCPLDMAAYALCQMPEFIGGGCVPDVFEFGVTQQFTILEYLASFHVHNCVNLLPSPCLHPFCNAQFGFNFICRHDHLAALHSDSYAAGCRKLQWL